MRRITPTFEIHRCTAALVLFACALFAPSAHTQDDSAEYRRPADRPALVFGERVFTYEEFAAWLLRERGPMAAREYAFVEAIERRAAEIGLDLSDAPERAKVAADFQTRIDKAFGGDREAWLEEITRLEHTEAGVWAMRMAEERHARLSHDVARHDWQFDERHVVRTFEELYGPEGRGITLRVLHLRFVPPENPPGATMADQTRLQNEARAVLLERAKGVRAGIASLDDFAAAVAAHSDHAETKANGGLWPGIVKRSDWPPENLATILALPEGGISEPVAGKGGFYIFAVEKVVTTPLESVRTEVEERVRRDGPIEMDRAEYLLALQAAMDVRHDDAAVDEGALEALRTGSMLVDGREVSLYGFGRWLADTQGETYVDLFASRVAVSELEARREIAIAPEELAARIDRELIWTLENGFQGRKERWMSRLAGLGIDEQGWRRDAARRLKPALVAEKVIVADRVVTEEVVRSLYIERYGETGERLDVRHIVVDLGIDGRQPDETEQAWLERAQPAIEEHQEELAEIMTRYEEGEDFLALARRYSDDKASLENGARPVGGFDEERLPNSTRVAVRDLPLGRMSAPQLVGTSVVFYEVLAREKVDYESVREQLEAEARTRPPSAVDVALFYNSLVRPTPPQILPGMFE
jgi:parvulin-like peptidyl-prolyl isomerase